MAVDGMGHNDTSSQIGCCGGQVVLTPLHAALLVALIANLTIDSTAKTRNHCSSRQKSYGKRSAVSLVIHCYFTPLDELNLLHGKRTERDRTYGDNWICRHAKSRSSVLNLALPLHLHTLVPCLPSWKRHR